MSDAAITNIVTGLVTITTLVMGFLTLWVKLRYDAKKAEEISKVVESKIDSNTLLTLSNKDVAIKNASVAVSAAAHIKNATEAMAENIDKKLNGGLDRSLEHVVKPLQNDILASNTVLLEHVKEKFTEFDKYSHQRNHDVLNIIAVLSGKIDVLIELMKKQVR